jgi:hypothetical protein
MMAAFCSENQANSDLPLVLFAYRTSKKATTQSSPFELIYGREPRSTCDLDSSIAMNQVISLMI